MSKLAARFFGNIAFGNIASKEHGTKEGEFSQGIVDSLKTNNEDDFFSAFTKKVGNRGGYADLNDKKEQVMKLACVVKSKFGSEVGNDFDEKFLTPISDSATDDQVNELACELMSVIGISCENAMSLPEFDAVRDWIKLDYATSRCLYG
jgi:hypothetical protein